MLTPRTVIRSSISHSQGSSVARPADARDLTTTVIMDWQCGRIARHRFRRLRHLVLHALLLQSLVDDLLPVGLIVVIKARLEVIIVKIVIGNVLLHNLAGATLSHPLHVCLTLFLNVLLHGDVGLFEVEWADELVSERELHDFLVPLHLIAMEDVSLVVSLNGRLNDRRYSLQELVEARVLESIFFERGLLIFYRLRAHLGHLVSRGG